MDTNPGCSRKLSTFKPDSLFTLLRIRCPLSTGFPVHVAPKSASTEEQRRRTVKYTKEEIEELVVYVRLELYNRGLSCGSGAIQNRIRESGITSGPSERIIGGILDRHGLTHGRTGIYPGEEIEA